MLDSFLDSPKPIFIRANWQYAVYKKEIERMNTDVMQGKWKQMRGEVKKWWGNLTDDDLDRIAGERDKLIGRLQERYGYARERAEEEVDRRFREYERTAH
jgi:uncharacterized protein YjbJ (UPF0337 family)